MATECDMAWAAGLFEGEGCFGVYRRSSGKLQVQARLAMTDGDVVDRFAGIIGVGSVRKRHSPADIRNGWKPAYEWYTQDALKVIAVIDVLLPWLGERRRAKASEVRAAALTIQPHNAKKTHCPKGHPFEGDNLVLEPIREGRYTARRCRTCRNEQERLRALKAKEAVYG